MTTPSASETKRLLVLAERMGIPVDEAMRQVAARDRRFRGLLSRMPAVEKTIVLSPEPETVRVRYSDRRARGRAREPAPEPDPASAPVA